MSFSTRVNATRLKSETICGKVDAWSPPWLEENRQLNPPSRALPRVAVVVPPRERKAPGERAKIHLFRRGEVGRTKGEKESLWKDTERGQGRTERKRERETPNCRRSPLLPSHHGVISCKALLSRCGNFIFATNLRPPPSPLSSFPSILVLCPVTLRLLLLTRAVLFSSLPGSSPFLKFALNAQFHLHRFVHFRSTSVSFHQECIALSWVSRLILVRCYPLYSYC